MDARCMIQLDGRSHGMEIEHLKRESYRRYSTAVHMHPSYHLILIGEGCNEARIADRAPFEMKSSSLLFINPLVPHSFHVKPGGMVEHISLIWRFRGEDGSYALFPLQELNGGAGDGKAAPFIYKELSQADAKLFESRHRQALEAMSRRGQFPFSMLAFELFFFGFKLLMQDEPCGVESPGRRLAAQVKAIVEREMVDPGLDIPRIAAELGMHPNYVNSAFKAQEGATINHYVRDRRLELAKSIMRVNPGRPLAEVASLCGFSRHNYFTRTFRKACGVSPAQYRDSGRKP